MLMQDKDFMRAVTVTILAGGQGTRLWPLSTPRKSKPFVRLGPLGRLYQKAVERAVALEPGRIVTVGAPMVRPQCRTRHSEFLAEPCARNTAPAVALAAVYAWAREGPSGSLLVLPSDHHIKDTGRFVETVRRLGRVCIKEGALGVMGIQPSGPETAYGYIRAGMPLGEGFAVERFIEKPDRPRAERLMAEGGVTWNSGMFFFPLEVLRDELTRCAPGIWEAAEAWIRADDPARYGALNGLSIDYALMEKTDRAAMVPADFGWSDLGTFPSLYAVLPRDADGNAGWGPGRVADCRNCLVITRRSSVLVKGLRDQVVVETSDGLLAVPMAEAGDIRRYVEAVSEEAGRRGRAGSGSGR
jgi:mannose-1-phosphate guanylyltransferase/mannose-6-phosphate isomerase